MDVRVVYYDLYTLFSDTIKSNYMCAAGIAVDVRKQIITVLLVHFNLDKQRMISYAFHFAGIV